jgi:thiosulfate/3-mercaptopyruvate sulfurtransferase
MVSLRMVATTLITAEDLASRIADPAVAIVDCRFRLDDVAWGEREYMTAHIPRAVYAHLDRDLSGPKTGANGRHPLPDVAALTTTLGRLGIANDVQVVAYDQDNGMYASRLWWLLRSMGHDAVAVLDGGFRAWCGEGRETATGLQTREARVFDGSRRPGMAIDVATVGSLVGNRDWLLLDVRAPERYRGETEPLDKTPGHIPGAKNYFFQWSLKEGGGFLAPDVLRAKLGEALSDVPTDRVVCYCGSGVTACHTLLALEHAGFHGAKLYPGSWSEWSSNPARPVARE